MFIKSHKSREFIYRPRYYKPEPDEEKPRIQFRRLSIIKYNTKKRPVFMMIALVIIIILLLRYWIKIDTVEHNELKLDNLKIEEIR